jgi:hypothetical protein
MTRLKPSAHLAAFMAVAMVAVSFACVISCWNVTVTLPPCHRHAQNCAPLLLTAEAPVAAFVAPLPAIALAPEPEQAVGLALPSLVWFPVGFASPPPLAPPFPLVLRV